MKNKSPLANKNLSTHNGLEYTLNRIKEDEKKLWVHHAAALKTQKNLENELQILQNSSTTTKAELLVIQKKLRASRMQAGKEFRFAALGGF